MTTQTENIKTTIKMLNQGSSSYMAFLPSIGLPGSFNSLFFRDNPGETAPLLNFKIVADAKNKEKEVEIKTFTVEFTVTLNSLCNSKLFCSSFQVAEVEDISVFFLISVRPWGTENTFFLWSKALCVKTYQFAFLSLCFCVFLREDWRMFLMKPSWQPWSLQTTSPRSAASCYRRHKRRRKWRWPGKRLAQMGTGSTEGRGGWGCGGGRGRHAFKQCLQS